MNYIKKFLTLVVLLVLVILASIPFMIGFIANFIIVSIVTGYEKCPEMITDLIIQTRYLFGMDNDEDDDEPVEQDDEDY